ncbi:MAG: glutamate 5-kinase [Polyangiaceae bacterium]|nr:glutamate 5-kinase [Polyangiaceae bacterium]
MTVARAALAHARRVVVKVGSRALSSDPSLPASLTAQLAKARALPPAQRAQVASQDASPRHPSERRFVLVSSGAIALGCGRLGYTQRPKEMSKLQAAAAAGQSVLMRRYEDACAEHGLIPAQVLLTHADLADRERLNNARGALSELLDAGLLPIVNENDTVSTDEIRFGDNDQLAAMVVPLVGAEVLLLLTDVSGVLDAEGQRLSELPADFQVKEQGKPSGLGSGGIASKVDAARKASRTGAWVVIASASEPDVIPRLLAGDDVGTLVHPKEGALRARQHWIAYTLRPRGAVVVDHGAAEVLLAGKSSLLPVGVLGVRGAFNAGDAVLVVDPNGQEVGRGLAHLGAMEVARIAGRRRSDLELLFGHSHGGHGGRELVVVHRDDLVLSR